MARSGIPVSQEIKDKFLEEFAACGVQAEAARRVGVNRSSPYRWGEDDPDFAVRFKEAQEIATDVLETEARRRALEGVEEPVYYKGKVVGSITRYSDTILMFLLNGRRSEVFKHRHELTGKDGGPIKSEVTGRLADLSEAELLELAGEDE